MSDAHTLFHAGELVICRVCKRSTHPGPRAVDVRPERAGEGYLYEVEKFWTVRAVNGDQLEILTRRGKLRVVNAFDPAIRKANWWERTLHRDRFPVLSNLAGATTA